MVSRAPRLHPSLRLAGLAAAGLVAFAGCSTTVTGSATPDSPRIVDVSIAGNSQVDDDDITDGLANRPPEGFLGIFRRIYRRLDRLALEQDIARIESYYNRRGFFSAKVVGTDIKPAGKGDVEVTFRVTEGKPTRVAGLSVVGLRPFLLRAKQLNDNEAPLRPGGIFRYDHYLEFKIWLGQWLAHRGYPHAVMEGKVDVDRDSHTADIRMNIDAGPLARFDTTKIRGLEHVPESAVRNRLAWEPGERFDPDLLELTQGRLYKLGLFSAVRMDYEKKDRPRLTDIQISLSEAKRHELRLGGGIAIEGGLSDEVRVEVRGRTDYVRRRVIGPLTTLRLEARPAWQWLLADSRNGPTGEATANLDRADFLFPRMTGTVTVGYKQDEAEAYATRGPLVRMGIAHQLFNDKILLGLGWRFQYLTFFKVDPALSVDSSINDVRDDIGDQIGLESPYRLAALEQTIAFDCRNNPLDPRRCWYAGLSFNEGGPALGGAFPFVRATADVRGYLPLGDRFVFAARAIYGRALGTDVLPITERFYDGGAAGHRGFGFRQLSPIEPGTEAPAMEGDPPVAVSAPIGGDESFLGSGEVRVDVAHIGEGKWPLGVVGFADGGDVTCSDPDLEACRGSLDLSNLHWAAGVGFRFNPAISLRLDFAYRLNRFGPDDPSPGSSFLNRFAFHFSLGQAF